MSSESVSHSEMHLVCGITGVITSGESDGSRSDSAVKERISTLMSLSDMVMVGPVSTSITGCETFSEKNPSRLVCPFQDAAYHCCDCKDLLITSGPLVYVVGRAALKI